MVSVVDGWSLALAATPVAGARECRLLQDGGLLLVLIRSSSAHAALWHPSQGGWRLLEVRQGSGDPSDQCLIPSGPAMGSRALCLALWDYVGEGYSVFLALQDAVPSDPASAALLLSVMES